MNTMTTINSIMLDYVPTLNTLGLQEVKDKLSLSMHSLIENEYQEGVGCQQITSHSKISGNDSMVSQQLLVKPSKTHKNKKKRKKSTTSNNF